LLKDLTTIMIMRTNDPQPGTLRLVPPAARKIELMADLRKMRAMFLTPPPDFDDLLAVLHEAEDTINGG
jgi:hypothetical protein